MQQAQCSTKTLKDILYIEPNQNQSRFTGATPQAISDLYDKVNHLEGLINNPTSTAPTTVTNTVNTVIRATEIGGATGQASDPQFALVPVLTALPSNNPTTGMPYTQNGLVILFNDQLWQYTGNPTYQWNQIATGTVLLSDTHAHRVTMYPPLTYPDALFVETDTLILLWSTGGVWTTLAGMIGDTPCPSSFEQLAIGGVFTHRYAIFRS